MRLVKDSFGKIKSNQLMAGSVVLFVGSAAASFGNYLYHLLMGRLLGPGDYGLLASLISLTYLFGVPVGALSLVVVKYVSALRGKKEFRQITFFYFWLIKKLMIFGLAGFLLLIVISPRLVSFLHLDSSLPVLLAITSGLVGIYLAVNTATLQGFLKFGLMSVLGIVQTGLKLGGAVLLVLLGWKVLGAIAAVLMSSLIGCFLTVFFVLRLLEKRKKKKKIINEREIIRYTIPVFFSTLAFTSLYTADIVLVRHFLPGAEAGLYAALATLGKIIFFASNPIVMVLFPIVSEKHANGKGYSGSLAMSLGLVSLICLGIGGLYFLFPKLMIGLLYGDKYLSVSSQLWLFAVFLSFYSLSYLLVNFYLSIKKTKLVILPAAAAVVQIVSIAFFHRSLSQVAWVSILVSGLLFLSLLIYYFLDDDQIKKTISISYRSRLPAGKNDR